MHRRTVLTPQYYTGIRGPVNENIREAHAGQVAFTITGNTLSLASNQGFGLANVHDNAWANDRAANRIETIGITAIGGADTVISHVAINGAPGFIAGQCNTGGNIAAIVYGYVGSDNGRSTRIGTMSAIIQTTGTAPTAAQAQLYTITGQHPYMKQCKTSTTAADTVRTITFDQTHFRDAYIAVAINNVAAANSCTWTGTTSTISESFDAAMSTARISGAQPQNFAWITEASGPTLTSTWAVVSTTGVSLCAAVFNNNPSC